MNFFESVCAQSLRKCKNWGTSVFYTFCRSAPRAIRGWDLEAKRFYPTLNRKSFEDGWGFSLIGGVDFEEAAGQYSGIVTRRGETGLWLKVSQTGEKMAYKMLQMICYFFPFSLKKVF